MMHLEEFLINRAKENDNHIVIVGGSPLLKDEVPEAISINGFHKECSVAAINGNRSDYIRCQGNFEHLIAPNATNKRDKSIIVPENKFQVPDGFPGRKPTTYFSLILTCDRLGIRTDVFAVCGRASKWHYGDWEMWYMQHKTEFVNIRDPRPKW